MDGFASDRRALLAGAGLLAGAALVRTAHAGPLNPPGGPVSSTAKPLWEIEPRVAVQSLPGSATAVHVISQPGSYYLTGNITGAAEKNGIEIAADAVSIDLVGFMVEGVAGSLNGITISGFRRSIGVSNGVVRDWGQDGVKLFDAGQNCIVRQMRASGNGGSGITARFGTLLADCVSEGNGGFGIFAHLCNVVGCTAAFNSLDGIQVCCGSLVRACAAIANTNVGIYAADSCFIESCNSDNNGAGVFVTGRCTASGNAIRSLNGVGINVFGEGNRVDGNSVFGGSTGVDASAGGNFIVRNTVRGATAAFSLAPGNSHGPIVNVAGVGDISAVPAASHPWANFAY